MAPTVFVPTLRFIRRSGIALSAFACVLLLVAASAPASPTPIVVNTNLDVVADDGFCSLREAITAADTDTASGAAAGECAAGTPAATNVITAPAGNYNLSLGELTVTSSLTVQGAAARGTVINPGSVSRVFNVQSTNPVSFQDVTLQNGVSPHSGQNGTDGGAILNAGNLTLRRVAVKGSAAASGLASGSTGTIDGGNGGNGGGIASSGTLTLDQVTLAGDVAGSGGQGNNGCNLTPTTGGNGGQGGGVYNTGTLNAVNVTFSGDSAGGGGLGGHDFCTQANGANGNSGVGGGLFNTLSATANLSYTTFSNDSSAASLPGGDISNVGALIAADSIFDKQQAFGPAGPACSGTITDGGFNISAVNSSGCPGTVANPQLAALANNGGPVDTHSFALQTPAFDFIPAADAACVAVANDARGVARPQGNGCDAGAYEANTPAVSLSPSVVFASTPAGQNSPVQVLVVTNTGTAPLHVSTTPITGSGRLAFLPFVDNQCAGATVAVGQTCTIAMRFSPDGAQSYSGTLSVNDDALNTPQTVTLTGLGTALGAGTTGPIGPTGPVGTIGPVGPVGTIGPVGPVGPSVKANPLCQLGSTKSKSISCKVRYTGRAFTSVTANLTRHRVLYASGGARRGKSLKLRRVRAINPGSYTLTLSYRKASRTLHRVGVIVTFG